MGSPIRILHVVVNMNRGGAETLLMNLYRNIDRTKIQFDFLTCRQGVFDKEIINMGGKIYRIPYITDVGPIKYQKTLDYFFKSHQSYKIVHSHMDKMSGLVLKSAKKNGIPVRIAHGHNTQSEGGLVSKLYKSLAGAYIKSSSTHHFACSAAAGKWLFGNNLTDVTILKNGIDSDQFQYSELVRNQVREELQVESNTIVIGHVGRFNQQKNHTYLLDVFSRVNQLLPNTILVLVGDGILRPKIEAKINELKLNGKVKLLGVRDDVVNLLQAFDMFVFPSLHEGLPVTLIEAQGTGLPCIISDSITNEVDMEMGLVEYLPLDESKKWVEKIVRVSSFKAPRNISNKALTSKGYDIRDSAQLVQDSYISLGV